MCPNPSPSPSSSSVPHPQKQPGTLIHSSSSSSSSCCSSRTCHWASLAALFQPKLILSVFAILIGLAEAQPVPVPSSRHSPLATWQYQVPQQPLPYLPYLLNPGDSRGYRGPVLGSLEDQDQDHEAQTQASQAQRTFAAWRASQPAGDDDGSIYHRRLPSSVGYFRRPVSMEEELRSLESGESGVQDVDWQELEQDRGTNQQPDKEFQDQYMDAEAEKEDPEMRSLSTAELLAMLERLKADSARSQEPIHLNQRIPNTMKAKRANDLRLSLTNNIDVLREKLYMEIARRNRARSQNQVASANSGLASIG